MRLNKSDFNAGMPYSSWLKEELYGEVFNSLAGFKTRGLAEKYKVPANEETENRIMSAKKLDDLPERLRKIAVDIIRDELDKDFEKRS